jgi:hypothetical protein
MRRSKRVVTHAEKIRADASNADFTGVIRPILYVTFVHICGEVSCRSSEVHLDEQVPVLAKIKTSN